MAGMASMASMAGMAGENETKKLLQENASLRREGDHSLIYLDLVNGFQAIIKLYLIKI